MIYGQIAAEAMFLSAPKGPELPTGHGRFKPHEDMSMPSQPRDEDI
jgi:hypothetical protein